MTYRLACADFAFPLLPHDQALQLIAMLGFQGADIGLFENRSHLWPSKEFKQGGRSSKRLKRKADDLGLKIADVFLQADADFVPYAINHPQARRRRRARDWFLKTLEYAGGCGCRHVTILPGVWFEDEEPARDSYGRALEELAWRLDRAKEHRITLGTEAHVGSLAPSPKKAAGLVRDVPGLTLTLDYTHFTRLGMPDRDVEPLLTHASHFHVRGACKGRLQAPFKDNTIDYGRILRQLGKSGYRGWLGVEYVWIDWEGCNTCDNLSETILFRDALRS